MDRAEQLVRTIAKPGRKAVVRDGKAKVFRRSESYAWRFYKMKVPTDILAAWREAVDRGLLEIDRLGELKVKN